MKPMDLLEAIGSIQDSHILNAHSKQRAPKKFLPLRKAFLIAAVIAMLLLLVGCVAFMMGLSDLKIGNFTHKALDGETISGDFISLQGYIGSDNHKATQEWNQFLDQYDPDGSLLKAAEEIGFIPPIDYMAYLCYTPDMVKKIDNICSKYNLEILGPAYGPIHLTNVSTEILAPLGIDSITASGTSVGVNLGSGYYYRDGSFNLDGDLELTDCDDILPGSIIFAYRCIKKTAFDGVALNIGNSEAYEQWNYTVTDGTKVLLALSKNKALIIADRDSFFITINILIQHMTRAELEAVADAFIFNYSPQRPDPSTLVEPEQYPDATETEEVTKPEPEKTLSTWKVIKSKFENILSGNESFFDADQCKWMTIEEYCNADVSMNANFTKYALADLDSDSIPELILWVTIDGSSNYCSLVIRYDGNGGAVGYSFTYRQMIDIKKDGTFGYSSGVADSGYARLAFTENSWEYNKLGYVEENDEYIATFFWGNKTVSQDVYWSYAENQDSKECVEWIYYSSDKFTLSFPHIE